MVWNDWFSDGIMRRCMVMHNPTFSPATRTFLWLGSGAGKGGYVRKEDQWL